MSTDMLIMEASLEDLAGVMRLYAQLNPDDPVLGDGRKLHEFKKIISSDNLFLFIGFVDGEIIVTCYLNIIPNMSRNASPYGIIENVVADREFRSRGYGKALVKHALDFAWSNGCYKVMLQSGSKRESIHGFYKACGFSANEKVAFVARPT